MGVSATTDAEDEVSLAAMGGATFDERLKQLATAKSMLEAAYNDLRIGKDAKAEYEKARGLTDDADAALAAARAEADNMRAVARAEADAIAASAVAERDAARAEAADALARAKAARDQAQADADAATEELASAKADRAQREKDIVKREAAAEEKAADADAREAAAVLAEKRWTDAMDALRAVIAKA